MSPYAIIAMKSLSLLSPHSFSLSYSLLCRYKHKIIAYLTFLFPSSVYYQIFPRYKALETPFLSLTFLSWFSIFNHFSLSQASSQLATSSPIDSVLERKAMCNYSSIKSTPNESVCSTFGLPWPLSKKHHKHLQLRLLKRRRGQSNEGAQRRKSLVVGKSEIEMKNLKLYMENQSILEENERLRKKALLLHEENQALLCQLQKKLSEQNSSKTFH